MSAFPLRLQYESAPLGREDKKWTWKSLLRQLPYHAGLGSLTRSYLLANESAPPRRVDRERDVVKAKEGRENRKGSRSSMGDPRSEPTCIALSPPGASINKWQSSRCRVRRQLGSIEVRFAALFHAQCNSTRYFPLSDPKLALLAAFLLTAACVFGFIVVSVPLDQVIAF